MTPAELVARRNTLKRDIKALEAELESVENQLKPIARDAFIAVPASVFTGQAAGLAIKRKLLRTDLRSSNPLATARFFVNSGLDVLTPGLVSKAKLDAYDPLYSDHAVLLKGEAVPGLVGKPVHSFEYEVLSEGVSVGDLD